MAVWVITVPIAEPATPNSRTTTSNRFNPTLTAAPMTATNSGVRVSCSPRSTPVVASTVNIAGIPTSDHLRKVTPNSDTAGLPPNQSTSCGASGQPTSRTAMPMINAR